MPVYVAEVIKKEFPTVAFSKEKVYAAAAVAVRLGFLVLVPPFELNLQAQLTKRYPHLANHVHVVHTANPLDNKKVSTAAALIALERAEELASKLDGQPLGLGLGPGRATRDFCESLSELFPKDGTLPKLNLFAITAGGPAREPQYAPISFFNQFDDRIVEGRIGLFAENLVRCSEIQEILDSAGVKEAYKERDNIHIVVTSMGDMNDRHDLLRVFLEESDVDVDELLRRGLVGNVQYRPYTADGPVKEKPGHLRAVTLFELKDLVDRAQRDDRHVILIARQCARCNRTRARALEPLLKKNSKLKVFSDLIMDAATCQELLTLDNAA